jgi:hypothetical protein
MEEKRQMNNRRSTDRRTDVDGLKAINDNDPGL